MKDIIMKIMDLKTKETALKIWLSTHKQIGYTSEEVILMKEVLSKERRLEDIIIELSDYLNGLPKETLSEIELIFSNSQLMKEKYIFSFDQQKESVNEVLGFPATIEELVNKYEAFIW